MQLDSLDFYREHARRYPQLSHEFAHLGHAFPLGVVAPKTSVEAPPDGG